VLQVENTRNIACYFGKFSPFSDYVMLHVRKDTRLSPLYCTGSNGKLGGVWELGYTVVAISSK